MSFSSSPILRIRGLVKRPYAGRGTFEIQVPELSLSGGRVLLVKGAGGSGKSRLLNLPAMTLRPDTADAFTLAPSGQVASDVAGMWPRTDLDELGRLRATHMGCVLQAGGLLRFLSARENIALPCRLLGRAPEERVYELAGRLEIERTLDKRSSRLSVGEGQRVAVARALAHEPKLVLADQPTKSFRPVNARAVLEPLVQLLRTAGIAEVIASHDSVPESYAGSRLARHRLAQRGRLASARFWTGPPRLTA